MKLLPFLLFVILGCSGIGSLNDKPHFFGVQPTKIIWLQIAGLTQEHLSMMRLALPRSDFKSSLEKSDCVGLSWNYNLYDLRPSVSGSLMSQVTGSKNIRSTCEDLNRQPIWAYLKTAGYKTGVLVDSAGETNITYNTYSRCDQYAPFLNDSYHWLMGEALHSKQFFHATEPKVYEEGIIYYDKTCQKGSCFSSQLSNVRALYDQFSLKERKHLFLLQDYSLISLMKRGEVGMLKERLLEINQVLDYFLNKTSNDRDTLLLVSSVSPRQMTLPSQGAEWEKLKRNKQGVMFGRSLLMNHVFALGARSENFCGVYDESQLMSRILRKVEVDAFKINMDTIFGPN